MIKGIGIDIVEISRIEKILNRQPKLIDRILTSDEKEIFLRLGEKRKTEWLAGRFSAKEAFAKAYGTGIGSKFSFLDISILSDEHGKPVVKHSFEVKVHLSITHTEAYAAAHVIIEEG